MLTTLLQPLASEMKDKIDKSRGYIEVAKSPRVAQGRPQPGHQQVEPSGTPLTYVTSVQVTYILKVWDTTGGYAERTVPVVVIGRAVTASDVSAQEQTVAAQLQNLHPSPTEPIPPSLLETVTKLVTTVQAKKAQQRGTLTTADTAAAGAAASGLDLLATKAAASSPETRDALLGVVAGAFSVAVRQDYPKLVAAAAAAAAPGVSQDGSRLLRVSQMMSITAQALDAQIAAYRSNPVLWPRPPKDGCALEAPRARKAAPNPAEWTQLVQLPETAMDWLADGLTSGEVACVPMASEGGVVPCVHRGTTKPGQTYAFAGDDVQVELPADWYQSQGLKDGEIFDVRLLSWRDSPYFWTRSLDLPVRGITARDSAGGPLMTSRDSDREILITMRDSKCLAGAPATCAFFDSGNGDDWRPGGVEVVRRGPRNTTCRSTHLTDWAVVQPLPDPAASPAPAPSPGGPESPAPLLSRPRVWLTLVLCWAGYAVLQAAAFAWQTTHPYRAATAPRRGCGWWVLSHHVLLGIPVPHPNWTPVSRAAVLFSSWMAILLGAALAGPSLGLSWYWAGLLAGGCAGPLELALGALFLVSARGAGPAEGGVSAYQLKQPATPRSPAAARAPAAEVSVGKVVKPTATGTPLQPKGPPAFDSDGAAPPPKPAGPAYYNWTTIEPSPDPAVPTEIAARSSDTQSSDPGAWLAPPAAADWARKASASTASQTAAARPTHRAQSERLMALALAQLARRRYVLGTQLLLEAGWAGHVEPDGLPPVVSVEAARAWMARNWAVSEAWTAAALKSDEVSVPGWFSAMQSVKMRHFPEAVEQFQRVLAELDAQVWGRPDQAMSMCFVFMCVCVCVFGQGGWGDVGVLLGLEMGPEFCLTTQHLLGLGGGADPPPPSVIGQIFLRVFSQSKFFSGGKSVWAKKFLRAFGASKNSGSPEGGGGGAQPHPPTPPGPTHPPPPPVKEEPGWDQCGGVDNPTVGGCHSRGNTKDGTGQERRRESVRIVRLSESELTSHRQNGFFEASRLPWPPFCSEYNSIWRPMGSPACCVFRKQRCSTVLRCPNLLRNIFFLNSPPPK